MVTGGMLALPATPATLSGLVAAAEAAPDELSVIANVLLAPPLPFVPAELVGSPLLLVQLVHAGPLDEGARAVAPLRALATPVADFVRAMPYIEMFPAEAQTAPPRAVVRTFFADALDEHAGRELLYRLRTSRAQVPAAQIRVLGGAAARSRRRRLHTRTGRAGCWSTSAPSTPPRRRISFTGHGPTTPRPHSGMAEMPHTSTSSATRARSAFGPPIRLHVGPLADVKRRYDPENVFRLNQNVPPSTELR